MKKEYYNFHFLNNTIVKQHRYLYFTFFTFVQALYFFSPFTVHIDLTRKEYFFLIFSFLTVYVFFFV